MPNSWKHGQPYWAWVCAKQGCPWFGQEWRNQTGDPKCSMCGNPQRRFVGRYEQQSHPQSKRLNLDTGEWEHTPSSDKARGGPQYSPIGAPQVGVRYQGKQDVDG